MLLGAMGISEGKSPLIFHDSRNILKDMQTYLPHHSVKIKKKSFFLRHKSSSFQSSMNHAVRHKMFPLIESAQSFFQQTPPQTSGFTQVFFQWQWSQNLSSVATHIFTPTTWVPSAEEQLRLLYWFISKDVMYPSGIQGTSNEGCTNAQEWANTLMKAFQREEYKQQSHKSTSYRR